VVSVCENNKEKKKKKRKRKRKKEKKEKEKKKKKRERESTETSLCHTQCHGATDRQTHPHMSLSGHIDTENAHKTYQTSHIHCLNLKKRSRLGAFGQGH
jgi:hypothetical protein